MAPSRSRRGQVPRSAGAADIGMELAGDEQCARLLWREGRNLDLVGIVGRIYRLLVAAPRHRCDKQSGSNKNDRPPCLHHQLRPQPGGAPQPRSAFTTFSSASASFGAPWKMISPRSMA